MQQEQSVFGALVANTYKDVAVTVRAATKTEEAVVVRFRVRKLTSEMLVEHGIATLLTDIPPDMAVLLKGGDTMARLEAMNDKGAAEMLDMLKRMGPGFFKRQAKQAAATICAGVVAVWERPTANPGKGWVEAGDGGYWRPIRMVDERKAVANPAEGRLPVTALSKSARDDLAKAITEFSHDDGGVAEALATFR